MSDRERVAHLLRRFGLGASEAEIEYYGKGGWRNAVDRLLNYDSAPAGFELDPEEFLAQTRKNAKAVKLQDLQTWWLTKMICTQRPLEEKLTLFWHNHFATSAEKVDSVPMMHHQNDLFRTYGLGKFGHLLSEVSKDAAMMYWLDNQYNVKEHPNENFAREVMELFTLGIGNYTEKDVQEGARSFSGWTLANRRGQSGLNKKGKLLPNQTFHVDDKAHDNGLKAFLGNKGPFNGDDVLGILCSQPRTAQYIAWKAWKFFGADTPDEALVSRTASKFYDSALDMKVLLREIMLCEEFYGPACVGKLHKSPVDFTIGTLRQLGFGAIGVPQAARAAFAARIACRNMGMDVLFPPDVSGWSGGENWVSSATIVERIQWGSVLFGGKSLSGAKKATVTLSVDASSLFRRETSAVDTLTSVFDVSLPVSKRDVLMQAVGGVRGSNAQAETVSKLLFGSPEFQFC